MAADQMFTVAVAVIGGIFALLAGIFGPAISGWFARKLQRGQQRHDSSSPTPPTTQQIWERQDRQALELEAVKDQLDDVKDIMGAALGALAEVADQWTGPHPKISPWHIAMLRKHGRLPEQWKDYPE